MSGSAPKPVRVLLDIDGVLNVEAPGRGTLPYEWSAASWRRRGVRVDGFMSALPIVWSREAIRALRRIEALPGVEMMWCTTWRTQASDLFGPLVGIGEDWPFADQAGNREPHRRGWWKAVAAREALAAGYRVVWIDDEIAAHRSVRGQSAPENRLEWMHTDSLFMVCPISGSGLLPEHVEAILTWITSGERPD
ncbi:HAD domain-containing protein [Demequina sp.]|uniref:HAD domain-containing protein n=1 Tax=Demequina sp. TaxID=2050685 RepID=UPI003D0EDF0B